MPQLLDLVLKGRSLAAFKDRGEFADLFCNTRYSCLAERYNIFRKVKWRRPVVVQIFPNGISESRWVNTFNISEKIIRMHGMQPVGRQTFLWKIRNIESDDTTRLADDRRRKHMPVIWIRQVHGIDQWFIARDQSVQNRSIHQLAGPHEIGTLKARPLFQQITNPFVMHPVAPSRPEKLCLGEKQNEAAQACPVKDICIKKCCEGGNHASIQFQPACLRSHFRQGQFSLLGRNTLIGQKISKAHTAMAPHHAMWEFISINQANQKRP